jgi:hypothetical protein
MKQFRMLISKNAKPKSVFILLYLLLHVTENHSFYSQQNGDCDILGLQGKSLLNASQRSFELLAIEE